MRGSCSHEGLGGGIPPATNRVGDGELVVVESELGRTRDHKFVVSGGRCWTEERSGRSSSMRRSCSRERLGSGLPHGDESGRQRWDGHGVPPTQASEVDVSVCGSRARFQPYLPLTSILTTS
jgi:hypothetical protein